MTEKKTIVDLIAALRSGEYKKGTGHLRSLNTYTNEYSYCCEGVMCDISGVEVAEILPQAYDNNILITRYSKHGGSSFSATSAFAPPSVWEDLDVITSPVGDALMLWLPSYETKRTWDQNNDKWIVEIDEFTGWDKESFAGLNDFQGEDAKNVFTFNHIADLMEWAYVRNYGNA